MIFKPELAERIKAGLKTQTRRIRKPGEHLIIRENGDKAVFSVGPLRLKWLTGQTYAVQPGRTKAGIARFRLLDIRERQLQDISEEDARAEGVEPFATPTGELLYKPAFVSLWNEINGPGAFQDNPTVFALTFELAD